MAQQNPAGPEAKQASDAQFKSAVEVTKHLRKAIHARSIYKSGHTILTEFIDSAHQKLTEYIEAYDFLELGIGSMNPTLAGKQLLQEEKRNQSLTHRLFLQGVERVGFKEGVTLGEVHDLVDLWHETLVEDDDADQNFATRFWELDLVFIEVHAVSPYADGPNLSAEDRTKNEERITRMIDLVVDRSSDPSRVSMDPDAQRAGAREDIRQALDGFESLGEAQLKGLDARIRGAREMAGTATSWAELFKEDHEDIVRRAVAALLGIAVLSDAAEVTTISLTLARILRAFIDAKQPQEAARLVERTHDLVQDALGSKDARAEAWESLLNALGSEEVLKATITLMDDVAHTDACFSLLFFSRPEVGKRLLEALPAMTRPESRHMLAILIREREPSYTSVVEVARLCGPEAYQELLYVVENYGRRGVREVYAAGIEHDDTAVKHVAVSALPKDMHAELVSAFRTMLGHTDMGLRRIARDVVVRAHDAESGEAFGALFHAKGTDAIEQRTLIAAMGAVGGAGAGKHLRAIVDSGIDIEHRVAAALALAQVADAESVAFLTTWSKKLLVRGAVKDACKEALKRIEARGSAPEEPVSDSTPLTAAQLASAQPRSAPRIAEGPSTSTQPRLPRPPEGDDEDVHTEIEEDDDAPEAEDDFEEEDALSDEAATEEEEDTGDEDSVLVEEPGVDDDILVDGRAVNSTADRMVARPRQAGPSEQVREAMKKAELDKKGLAEQKKIDAVERRKKDEERKKNEEERARKLEETKRLEAERKVREDEEKRKAEADAATRAAAARIKDRVKALKKGDRENAARNSPIQAPVNRHRSAPTPDRAADPEENRQIATVRRRRAKGMPDFASMFASYVVYQAGGSVVFGRRYGQDVFDVHEYTAGDLDTAYAQFLGEKAREGFVPQTDRSVRLQGDTELLPIDVDLLEAAYERVMSGASS